MPSRPLGAGSTVAREVHKIEISSNQALVLFSNGVLAGGRIEHQAVLEILHEVEGCTAKGIFDEFAQEFSRRYGQMMNDDVTMVVIRRIEKRIVNGTTESV